MQSSRPGGDPVPILLFASKIGQTRVSDDGALRHSGRAGRVDDVRSRRRSDRRCSVSVVDGSVGVGGTFCNRVRVAEVDPDCDVPTGCRTSRNLGGPNSDPHTRILEHVRNSICGITGIDRDENATGFGDRPDCEHGVDRSGDGQCDRCLGADSQVHEVSSDPIRSTLQLPVRE